MWSLMNSAASLSFKPLFTKVALCLLADWTKKGSFRFQKYINYQVNDRSYAKMIVAGPSWSAQGTVLLGLHINAWILLLR